MSKYSRDLGPLNKAWNKYPIRERSKWAEYGYRELSKRLAQRLSITNRDAQNIIRTLGQESGNMLNEGWVFSIPGLSLFWTYTTAIKPSTLPEYKGQLLGGNIRVRTTESPILRKKFKEKKREIKSNNKPE